MANIQSGQAYKLINYKAGNIADLSGGDNRSIIGFDYHGGNNQKWYIRVEGDFYTFQNVEKGKYLGIDGNPGDGVPVIVVDHAQQWQVKPDNDVTGGYRIFYPNTRFNLDLSDHGSAKAGTRIQLWGKWEPGENQIWRFEKIF